MQHRISLGRAARRIGRLILHQVGKLLTADCAHEIFERRTFVANFCRPHPFGTGLLGQMGGNRDTERAAIAVARQGPIDTLLPSATMLARAVVALCFQRDYIPVRVNLNSRNVQVS